MSFIGKVLWVRNETTIFKSYSMLKSSKTLQGLPYVLNKSTHVNAIEVVEQVTTIYYQKTRELLGAPETIRTAYIPARYQI